jgi:hypothetical protein
MEISSKSAGESLIHRKFVSNGKFTEQAAL